MTIRALLLTGLGPIREDLRGADHELAPGLGPGAPGLAHDAGELADRAHDTGLVDEAPAPFGVVAQGDQPLDHGHVEEAANRAQARIQGRVIAIILVEHHGGPPRISTCELDQVENRSLDSASCRGEIPESSGHPIPSVDAPTLPDQGGEFSAQSYSK